MSIEEFRGISIRGRMAFAISCFKNMLAHFNLRQSAWQIIIDKFWKFTDTKYLDIWFEEAIECDPSLFVVFGKIKLAAIRMS